MRFAFTRMNSPGRFLVAIERVRDRPAFLIEIGARVHERDLAGSLRTRLESEQVKFAEMKVAVDRLPTGAALGEAFVGENFHTHRRDRAEWRAGADRINIALWRGTRREQRTIGLSCERGAAC